MDGAVALAQKKWNSDVWMGYQGFLLVNKEAGILRCDRTLQEKKEKKDKKDKEKKKDKKEPAADAEVAMPAMSRDEMNMLKEILKQKSCIFQVPLPPHSTRQITLFCRNCCARRRCEASVNGCAIHIPTPFQAIWNVPESRLRSSLPLLHFLYKAVDPTSEFIVPSLARIPCLGIHGGHVGSDAKNYVATWPKNLICKH